MSKLVYFTNSFPYGHGENWKYTELLIFAKYFDYIVVVPLSYGGNKTARNLPNAIKTLTPLFVSDSYKGNSFNAIKLFIRYPLYFYRLFQELDKVQNFDHLKSLVVEFQKVNRILNSEYFKSHVFPELDDAILYFFWGKGYADILPFLSSKYRNKSIVRFHGYDLYKERNSGYVPHQKMIVRSAKRIVSISKHGFNYLSLLYPGSRHKIWYSPLGTAGKGMSPSSTDGKIRLVSCAFVRPVKRLHLIVEGLMHVKSDVIWTHIGGGDGLPELVDLSKDMPSNIQVNFTGSLSADEVSNLYASEEFDVFLNVSSSEGVPVSIMEALAAGIPIIATNVGGTNEIVDDKVGVLLQKEIDGFDVAEAIENFVMLPQSVKSNYRKASYERYKNCLIASDHASRLAKKIQSIIC